MGGRTHPLIRWGSGRILSTVHRPDTRKKRCARPAHGAARSSLFLLVSHRRGDSENVGEGTKKEQTQAHRTAPDEQDAALSCSERHRPCSKARQRTVVPRSGRRGRRFKSCHPDQCSPRFRDGLRERRALCACPAPRGGDSRHDGTRWNPRCRSTSAQAPNTAACGRSVRSAPQPSHLDCSDLVRRRASSRSPWRPFRGRWLIALANYPTEPVIYIR